MRLRALKGFSLGGGVDVAAGDEFEEPGAWQANYWLGLGYVEHVVETPPPAATQPAGRTGRRKE